MILEKKPLLSVLPYLKPFWLILLMLLISFRFALLPALASQPPAPGSGRAALSAPAAHPTQPLAWIPGFLPSWEETFEYPDGAPPDSIRTYGAGGTLHSLAVENGRLVGSIDTNFYFNLAALQWSPAQVSFNRHDLVSLAYQGTEQQGLFKGNWYHSLRIVPECIDLSCFNMAQPGIELLTQQRASDVWARAYRDGRLVILASQMYKISSGQHSYLLEINHVAGEPLPGALRFYRDGRLVAASDDVLPFLTETNQLRFLIYSDDPAGAVCSWEDIRIWISPGLPENRAGADQWD